MAMTERLTVSLTAVRYRLKQFRTKVLASFIAVLPFRPGVIELLSRLFSIFLYVSKRSQRAAIVRGAGRMGLKPDARSLARQYFLHTARARVWAAMIFDVKRLQKHVSVFNVDQLKREVGAGRGAILVGAHIGPPIYSYALWRQGVIVRPLTGGGTWRRFHRFFAGAPPFFRTGKVEFISETMRP